MAGRQSRLERTFECTLGCLCERSLGIQIHMHIHTHMYVPCGDTYVSPATLTPTLTLALALLTIWSCSPWHTTTAHRIAAPLPRSSLLPCCSIKSAVQSCLHFDLCASWTPSVSARNTQLGSAQLSALSSLVSLFSPLYAPLSFSLSLPSPVPAWFLNSICLNCVLSVACLPTPNTRNMFALVFDSILPARSSSVVGTRTWIRTRTSSRTRTRIRIGNRICFKH